MLQEKGDMLYVGVDESNHGRFPEIFVAVASFNYQDSLVHNFLRHVRGEHRLSSSLRIRDYKYSVITKEHYEKYLPKNIMPLVSSKLISSFDLKYEHLNCFIDGELKSDQRKLLEALLKNQESLDFQSLSIQGIPKGSNHKKTNYLISLADGWANWIAKKTISGEMTSGMKNRRIEFI